MDSMIVTGETTTAPVVQAQRITRARMWEGAGLSVALITAAVLNFWNLAANGYGNTYYAVAVQSMVQSFSNFWYGAYDAGGFITVDKPPVALWIQAISAKLFGFNGLALLVPEALAGTVAVGLLYFLVRRAFGPLAGFVAALTLAVTPIAVAVNRTNNMDTWLMFVLMLAAWALTYATEKGRLILLCLSTALVGVAFNIKMLEAFIVLPAFYLLYFLAAPISWPRRIAHLAVASVALFGVAFSWPLAVDLTAPDARPYIGGSQTNSVFNLAFGYNGFGRVTGQGEGMPGDNRPGGNGAGRQGGFGPPPGAQGNFPPPTGGQGFPLPPNGAPGNFPPPAGAQGGPGGAGGPGGGGTPFNSGTPGVGRLFGTELAGQWSWLFPLAALGLGAAALGLRRRRLLDRRGQALLLWVGWGAMYGIVFSFASGIFHSYYLNMMGPALGGLAGVGVAALWAGYRLGGWRAWGLPIVLLLTAAWQAKVLADYPQWAAWMVPLILGGALLAAGGLVAARLAGARLWRRIGPAMAGLGLAAIILAPMVWSVQTTSAAGNTAVPSAGPNATGGPGGVPAGGFPGTLPGGQPGPNGVSASNGLIQYLQANRAGAFYLMAVSGSMQAGSIALATGQPVLAWGGFNGGDAALTTDGLAQMVAANKIRFVMTGGGGGPGGDGNSAALSAWVQSTCKAVDASAYGGQTAGSFGGPGGLDGQLYDCAAR